MRLFLAIELTDAAREAIAAEQERIAVRLRSSSGRPRFVKPEHMHLTLVFLGEVADERVPAIVEAGATPIAQSSFVVGFGGIGTFPPRGAPRVLWLGVVEGEREVIALQAAVAARLVSLGVPPEARPFHPHLTLARWRDGQGADRPPAEAGTPKTIARVEVRTVTLFQSRLSSNGPTYTALAQAPLQ
jgi:2'-5' RNA ligase